jgi:hypothetical protein
MSTAYLTGDWKHASELPGVGDYAARMWEIFFLGKLGDEPPNDGALKLYWYWMKLRDLQENSHSLDPSASSTASFHLPEKVSIS